MVADYQERLVAFVDMLGFTEFVNQSETQPQMVGWLHDAVEAARTSSISLQETASGHPNDSLQITNFSDSIVISDLADEVGFGQVMFATMEVALRLQYLGILVRGGIGTGKLFHRDRLLFGPAFIEAYELERSVATAPQIVFSSRSVGFLESLCQEHAGWQDWLKNMTVMERSPRLVRLEPFHVFYDQKLCDRMNLPFTVGEFCARVKNTIQARLREYIDQPRTFHKYEWAAQRLNELIRTKVPELGTIDPANLFDYFRPGSGQRE